jgi:hypothetical protein
MKAIASSFIVVLLVAIALTGCEPMPEDLFVRHFVMEKGTHYSTPRLAEMLQANSLKFKATFNETAIYDLGDKALQSNKNKLMGFSDCNSMHHENSARFGWQWFDNQLEIYAYCYVNGERKEEFIGTVNINEENLYEIQITDDAYVFYLNNERVSTIQRGTVCDQGIYYMLYPYFGGSVPAPHDVRIDISMLR